MGVKAYFKVLGVSLMVGILAGCAEVPQQDVDAAKAAVAAAESAEANMYAVPENQAANDSLAAAMAEIEAQGGNFALFRNYDRAQSLLKSTVSTANMAAQMAVDNKAMVKAEVDSLIVQTQAALEQTKELMKKAPRGKESKAVLDEIGQELATVEASLMEVSSLVDSGKLLEARDRLHAGMEKTMSINTELSDAIAKKQGLSRKSPA